MTLLYDLNRMFMTIRCIGMCCIHRKAIHFPTTLQAAVLSVEAGTAPRLFSQPSGGLTAVGASSEESAPPVTVPRIDSKGMVTSPTGKDDECRGVGALETKAQVQGEVFGRIHDEKCPNPGYNRRWWQGLIHCGMHRAGPGHFWVPW
jgi:hypothetical protein